MTVTDLNIIFFLPFDYRMTVSIAYTNRKCQEKNPIFLIFTCLPNLSTHLPHTYANTLRCGRLGTHIHMQGKSMRNLINMKILLFTYSHLYAEIFESLTCNERGKMHKLFYFISLLLLYYYYYFFFSLGGG